MVRFASVGSFAALSLLPMTPLSAQDGTPDVATGFVDKTLTLDGVEHRYVVYVPPGYTASRAWPLILFLNGRGECGTDGRRQASVGLGAAIRRQPERWPFVVVFPQKPKRDTQWGDHEELAMAALAAAQRDYRVDAGRRFLTGLSQGGSGAWELGAKHAETWAAVAPVCGYRLGAWSVKGLRDTPVWAFHGLADEVVPANQSRLLTGELNKAGGAPALTLYEVVGHNSWDRAYGESALAEWFRLIGAGEALGARYLADRPAVEQFALVATDAADGGAPRELRIAALLGTITWRVDDASGTLHGSNDGDWQTLHPDAAQQLVWRTLVELVRAGAFARPPAGAAPQDGEGALQLEIVVRGAHGEWTKAVAFEGATPAADRLRRVLAAAATRARASAERDRR